MKEINIAELDPKYNLFKQYGTIALVDNGTRTNGLTIGWGSVGVLWRTNIATIYIHKTRFSKEIFDTSKYFSINLFEEKYNEQVGYYGKVSGRDEDKIINGGLEVEIIDGVKTFKEAKYSIICEKVGQTDFDLNTITLEDIISWYKGTGVHTAYFGKILKVVER